jgi:FMN phosphatase YigB (HAD superfamily)
MIKAFIFDFGQTLVDSANGFRAAEKEAQDRIYSDLSLVATIESWESFLDNYRLVRKKFHDESNFSRVSIWQAVYQNYNVEPNPRLLETWVIAYWEKVKSETIIFPETQPVLRNLAVDYPLALITNTQGQKTAGTHRLSQYPELESFFEVTIVAGESNIPAKPDAMPFLMCAEKLGVEPSEAVYVGDDYRIDICGAKDAGLHPVWIKHHLVKRNWPDVETEVPIISSLNQLLELEKLFS